MTRRAKQQRRTEPNESDILVLLPFDPENYGPEVAGILTSSGPRETLRDALLQADARALLPGARDPESALSGLFLYFDFLTEAHDLLHRFRTPDSDYWHAIMHRMEGDAYNAGYWFHRIGSHPLFPVLQREAAHAGYVQQGEWDPFAFIRFCETSERNNDDALAKRVQLIEWQLLFDYCAARVGDRVAAR
jgi:hypothetical protein